MSKRPKNPIHFKYDHAIFDSLYQAKLNNDIHLKEHDRLDQEYRFASQNQNDSLFQISFEPRSISKTPEKHPKSKNISNTSTKLNISSFTSKKYSISQQFMEKWS